MNANQKLAQRNDRIRRRELWTALVGNAVVVGLFLLVIVSQAMGQQPPSDKELLVQYYGSHRSSDTEKCNALVAKMTAEGRMPEVWEALDVHFHNQGSSLEEARSDAIRAESVQYTQPQPQPQPYVIASYVGPTPYGPLYMTYEPQPRTYYIPSPYGRRPLLDHLFAPRSVAVPMAVPQQPPVQQQQPMQQPQGGSQ